MQQLGSACSHVEMYNTLSGCEKLASYLVWSPSNQVLHPKVLGFLGLSPALELIRGDKWWLCGSRQISCSSGWAGRTQTEFLSIHQTHTEDLRRLSQESSLPTKYLPHVCHCDGGEMLWLVLWTHFHFHYKSMNVGQDLDGSRLQKMDL